MPPSYSIQKPKAMVIANARIIPQLKKHNQPFAQQNAPQSNRSTVKRTLHFFDNGSVENRILLFQQDPPKEKLVFVPNWRAEERHWLAFVEVLTDHYDLVYFESREKEGTRFKSETIDFTIEQMGRDLAHFLNSLNEPYHLVAASIGTSAFIKSIGYLKIKPKSLTLIYPVLNLNLPLYFHLFPFISENMIKAVAPIIFRLMQKSRQMNRVAKMLQNLFENKDLAALKLLKASVQDLINAKIELSEVQYIDCPCLVVYSENDLIHQKEQAKAMAQAIPKAALFSALNFKTTHQPECAKIILKWQGKI